MNIYVFMGGMTIFVVIFFFFWGGGGGDHHKIELY